MKHLNPRWRKVLRDIWTNKARTVLVVISLAVGIFTVGFLINTESLLGSAFTREYAAVNPSSATLIIPQGFDGEFLDVIRRMPEIDEADGRGTINLRLKVGTNQWINLNLSAIDDFDDIRIDKVQSFSGAWPPEKGEILLERSSLNLAAMPDLKAGDVLTVQTRSGDETTLNLAGIAYDFNRTPSVGTGIAYGYITLDTLERLGGAIEMNELRIVVAQDKLDENHIRQVTDRVREKIEEGGRSVASTTIPDPGQHPLGTLLDSLNIILGALSVLTLVGGALLVFNTIAALLAQQIRQIGIMKAVGGRGNQIMAMYLGLVLVFGLLAMAVTTPLSVISGIQAAGFLADFFNLELGTIKIPAEAFFVQALVGFGVPLLAALYPVLSGVRVTVREAISDYGVRGMEKTTVLDRYLSGVRIPAITRPAMLSIRNTFRRRVRLTLTLLPLALSGAILITVINVRASLKAELDEIFNYRQYDVNLSFDRPYRLADIENVASGVSGILNLEDYRRTYDAYRLRPDGSRSSNIALSSLSPGTDTVHLPLIEGRWLMDRDRTAAVVNTAFLRDEMDVRLGDQIPFKINGRKFTLQVVGVVDEKMAPSSIYVNDSHFGKILGGVGRADNLWVVTDADESPADVKDSLETKFEEAGLAVIYLKTAQEERSFIEFHFNIMIVPLGLAALMLALVGGLGLTGTMSTNVLERSREVGVMRAIGASDGGVQKIFMLEGLVIGVISWFFGVATALPLTLVFDEMVGTRFLYAPLIIKFPIGGSLIWLVIVLLTAALACYVPARDASRTSVRELLAYE